MHNLLFAGEHTNSFYEWQGFLEGAALSGLAAARHILVSGRLPGTSPRANLREIDSRDLLLGNSSEIYTQFCDV
ncbi:FAD-dependent oxidoreductase [Alkalinema sp. FACHB-956]|nr:FAD-dependent oxidoreductase [Alkalinema sp. FACHB-956]